MSATCTSCSKAGLCLYAIRPVSIRP